ncbi:MAG TPA: IPT/TIG domain-containing protein [Candidatus Paceibacterota bacterium]|nr:IPT/TIG domain-containing protein [Candidatus Paceibacterota bacterium]
MIKWNEYTWYSRLAALIVFILLLPILTFYLGVQYQKTADVLSLSANAPLPAGNYSNSGGSIPVTIVTSTTTSTTTVITTTSKPQINSLNPSSGSAGTEVTISGLNFDRNSNQITFGSSNGRHHPDGSADNVIANVGSADGKTLTFTVPASGPSGILCSSAGSCIGISALRLTSGTYPVSVINKNGTSNVVQFSLTE